MCLASWLLRLLGIADSSCSACSLLGFLASGLSGFSCFLASPPTPTAFLSRPYLRYKSHVITRRMQTPSPRFFKRDPCLAIKTSIMSSSCLWSILVFKRLRARIISIIRGSFLQSEVFRHPLQPAKNCAGPDGPRG